LSASDAALHAAPAPRLAGLPLLFVSGVVLVALLAVVFPTGREYAAFTSETKPDAYSLAYLEVLTRANPRQLDLRLVYAKQLATLGRYDEALAAATPVLSDPRLGLDAKNLRLDVSLARARAIAERDPRRAAAFVDVHAQVRALLAPALGSERREDLAKLALELDDPWLAADFYLALANTGGVARPRHLANAERWLRASGDNARAAQQYRLAHDAAKTPHEAVDYALLAVASLESGNRVHEAADLAAEYARLHAAHVRVLATATRLATACARPAAARELGRRWLALAPDDEQASRDQVGRELGAADPKAALQLLNRLLARHPDDYNLHYQRARVAEWAGDLDTTERDLLWLVSHTKERK